MGTRDTLAVGRELTVWLPPQAGGATSSAANSNDTLQRIRYTVRPGDSLYAIASRFKVSIADLRRWNGLASDLLHPGQKLTLHVDVTRQARAD
jgi:membrane-bound lytic murein transglycosylase D